MVVGDGQLVDARPRRRASTRRILEKPMRRLDAVAAQQLNFCSCLGREGDFG
jgi:hypothetical protein